MEAEGSELGGHIGTHGTAGGLAGLESRQSVRTALLTFTGLVVGFIPGLIVTLFADLWPALIIGPLLGAVAGFLWGRTVKQEAAVTEARLHEHGVVFVDGRGSHAVRWDAIVAMEGRHVQNVARTDIGDIRGVTSHMYRLQTRDGTGFWLDDRVQNVVALADTIARASGVQIARMQ